MDAGQRIALLGLLVFVLPSSLSAPAKADGYPQPRLALVADYSDDPALGINGTLAVAPVETSVPLVPRECKARYMTGPAVGVSLAAPAVGAGAGVIWLGATYESRAAIIGGSALLLTGVVALALSARALTQRRQARRDLCGLRERWP